MSVNQSEVSSRLQWTAENARSVFEHYSGLRIQMTVLNITAIGAFSIFNGANGDGTVRKIIALLVFATLFGVVSYRLSRTCAIHWGIYRRSRNELTKEFSKKLKISENANGGRTALARAITRTPNLVFWPLLNVLAPLSAIFLLLLPE